MKNTYLFVFLLVFKMSLLSAQVSPSNEGLTITKNGIPTVYYGSGGTPIFNGTNFGLLLVGTTLNMSLPFMNISSTCPAQSSTFSYRIYATTAPPSAGSVVNLSSVSSTLWNNTTTNINILSGLVAGSYKIDIKYDYQVQPSPNVICAGYTSGWISAGFSIGAPTGPGPGPGPSGPSSPLAVEMSTFTARKQNNKEIAILWKTGQEKANKSFNVERSSDGLSFSKIGSMQGAENSVVEKAYNFTDLAPLQGVNYYRLTSVDAQGKETTSKIVSVNFSDKLSNKLQIYPNPTHLAVQIELISDEETSKPVQVFDLAGRMILSQNALLTKGLNNISLDVNTFSSGTYLVKIGSEMSRFVKL
jgi:Secretion system C-terminal sorting domain